ncbi:MAG: hypothetical protein Kow0098_03660 [Ignavibacteriaceae bacterium]
MKWIAEQIEWVKSFFQEESGKASMKRLIQFIIAVTFLRAYYKVTMINEDIVDVPEYWMILLCASVGLGIIGNYYSKKDPNKSGNLLEKIKNGLGKKNDQQ